MPSVIGPIDERAVASLHKSIGAQIDRLPITIKISLIFSVVMLTAICFTLISIYELHKISVRGVNIATINQSKLEQLISQREKLGRLNRLYHQGQTSNVIVAEVQRDVKKLHLLIGKNDQPDLTQNWIDSTNQYLSALKSPNSLKKVIDVKYEKALVGIATLIENNHSVTYRSVYRLRREMEKSVEVTILVLLTFLGSIVLAGIKIVAFVTRPLTELSKLLDEIAADNEFLSEFGDGCDDDRQRCFSHLIYKLRTYSALNVRRSLFEKRRADIIARSTNDGVILLQNDEIVSVNPIALRMLSVPEGKKINGLKLSVETGTASNSLNLTEDDLTKYRKAITTISNATTRTIPIEFKFESPEGRKYCYLIQAYRIPQELVEKVDHSLQGSVSELLDQWQADTLVLARDITLVKESQEAKGHFIATLSHEVKTPVTSLTMATRLLKRSVDRIPDEMHRTLINTCVEDVDRLRKLIDDLLTISKFDLLTQVIELQTVDLNKLMRQSLQHFQPEAFERGVEIVSSTINSRQKVLLRVDPTKISWAVSNLITNALRHSPRGEKVHIELERTDKNVVIKVKDHGPGVDRNRKDKIFERFNPYYDLHVARTGSAGTGLSIAKEIVVAHGGDIKVNSEIGKGSEFLIYLPAEIEKSDVL